MIFQKQLLSYTADFGKSSYFVITEHLHYALPLYIQQYIMQQKQYASMLLESQL